MPRDEQELAAIAALTETIYKSPKTRKKFLGLVKDVAPSTPIPELEIEDQVEARVKPVREELEKTRAEIEKERQERATEAEWKKAGVSAEERQAIETQWESWHKDGRLIGDVASAVELYRASQRVAAPRSGPARGAVRLPHEHETFKGLGTDMRKWETWSRDEAARAVNEFESQRQGAV